jgi:sugar/nucleoside kinase (ribokinase family)
MVRSRKSGVAVIGEFFIDEIFTGFNVLPKLGEECFARRFQREVGGGAAITACGLARLGVRVKVYGVVGASDGRWVIDRLSSFGVDCSGLQKCTRESTGITVSASTREDRAFFSYYGANQQLEALIRKPETADALSVCRHVHFACAPDAETDEKLFRKLQRGTRISIDVQSHSSWLTHPKSLQLLRNCTMFFPNEREGSWISGGLEPHDILLRLRDKGLSGVGLKLGGKGAALLWGRRQFLVDSYPVECVDTTGAGDCFNAGFIFAQLRGYPPQRCLEIANICGALSTRSLGGIEAFPSLSELTECESKVVSRATPAKTKAVRRK